MHNFRNNICAALRDDSGLPRPLATEVALQSVRGTTALAQKEQQHTAVLRDKITSPGGTTIAGLFALEKRAFRAAGKRV